MRYALLAVLFFFIAKVINGGWLLLFMISIYLPVTVILPLIHISAHAVVDFKNKASNRLTWYLGVISNVLLILSALTLPDASDVSSYSFFGLIKNPPALFGLFSYGALIGVLILDIILIASPLLKKIPPHVRIKIKSMANRLKAYFFDRKKWRIRLVVFPALIGLSIRLRTKIKSMANRLKVYFFDRKKWPIRLVVFPALIGLSIPLTIEISRSKNVNKEAVIAFTPSIASPFYSAKLNRWGFPVKIENVPITFKGERGTKILVKHKKYPFMQSKFYFIKELR